MLYHAVSSAMSEDVSDLRVKIFVGPLNSSGILSDQTLRVSIVYYLISGLPVVFNNRGDIDFVLNLTLGVLNVIEWLLMVFICFSAPSYLCSIDLVSFTLVKVIGCSDLHLCKRDWISTGRLFLCI